jgi:hypothetical protein
MDHVKIAAFVIMPNHIHVIWRIQNEYILEDVQRDFLVEFEIVVQETNNNWVIHSATADADNPLSLISFVKWDGIL